MIFISYATENLSIATDIFRSLCLKKYNVWFAPVAIKYGENFVEKIGNALIPKSQLVEQLKSVDEIDMIYPRAGKCSSCKAMIFICSRFSKNSAWCKDEIAVAKKYNIPIFVIRVDNSADSKEWETMLSAYQSYTTHKITSDTIKEILSFLPSDILPTGDIKTDNSIVGISRRDIQIAKISAGDPYFENGETLHCSLSKLHFYLAPPEDMINDSNRDWCEQHFSKKDVIFDSSLEFFEQQTDILDLGERIERSRKKVFADFVHLENGCYFNNKKYGINKINPYSRSEDYSEIPSLDIELYTTDYYTHRVIKDVCKNLPQNYKSVLQQKITSGAVENYKILLTSLGINLLLLDGNRRLNQKTILAVRSTRSAETDEEKIALSVIEGVSLSDYDHFQRNVNLEESIKRGLDEELGVKSEMLDSSSFRFYDLFVNLQNLEFGLSCSATLKDNISLEEVSQLSGKDKALEIESCKIIQVSDLRDYVLENKESFLPQAIYAIGSFLNSRDSEHPLVVDDVKKGSEECFCCGKTGNALECEDIIVQGEWFYAIIDGVTSKSPITYDGKSTGRYAAELLSDAILKLDKAVTAPEGLKILNEAISKKYVTDDVSPENRIQASVVIYSKYRREIWNYGDCKFMINESSFSHDKLIDKTLATLRSFCISAYLKRGGSIEALKEHDVGRECILPFLKEQAIFSNADGEFGYPVVDGTGINENLIEIRHVEEGDHVVLSSDGYPKLFSTLIESEEHLKKILETDPLSIKENKQTKMKKPTYVSFDDRAYLSFFVK